MAITIRRSPTDRLLELGGGGNPLVYPTCMGGNDVNVDVRICHTPDGKQTVDFAVDMNEPLPIQSNEFDGVVSHFALEHVSYPKVPQVVAEMFRVLKPGGKVVVVVPNTEAQMRYILAKPEWDGDESCMVFGEQNYNFNHHLSAFSPKTITKLFQSVGFTKIFVQPYGQLETDMCLEAWKPTDDTQVVNESKPVANTNSVVLTPVSSFDSARVFDRRYFNGGNEWGGYKPFYWDIPSNEVVFRKIILRKPESVLELGSARGYVLKRLQDAGIPSTGVDISEHCYLTRNADNFIKIDVTKNDLVPCGQHDLCFSNGLLEHIPEDKLQFLFEGMEKTCKRGLHGITFPNDNDGNDKSRVTLRPKEWWQQRLPRGHEVLSKSELESGDFPTDALQDNGLVKLNIGCAWTMFHHGWQNIDVMDSSQFANQYGYRFQQVDVRKGLPYATETVDAVFLCHVLEHFSYEEGMNLFFDLRRIIKPNGVIRII